MDNSLVCNGFSKTYFSIYVHNQTITHPLVTHTISKPTALPIVVVATGKIRAKIRAYKSRNIPYCFRFQPSSAQDH
ncbi:hypothetical protein RHMOL_Rhmol10G0104600 [Rhododendron molle]|uniref:Uncharacterized protein n=1 Tax=Rhododendron molle TaxID=49168 RepID=A0ACC0M195_RHOML|nr:hypothetical protein RHMOL_Rhmol10G0104600 [Rhododendron molle]